MACEVFQLEGDLVVQYRPEFAQPGWPADRFRRGEGIVVADVFFFDAQDLADREQVARWFPDDAVDDFLHFGLGRLEGDYYRIEGRKVGIKQDVRVQRDLSLRLKSFRATRGVSVFKQIAALTGTDIYVGGDAEQAIPHSEFLRIVGAVPTDHELRLYVEARISGILRNYIDNTRDAEAQYERLRNKVASREHRDLEARLAPYEAEKYEILLSRMRLMLERAEEYSERQWQLEVKDVILLAYPRYLSALPEAPIFDRHTDKERRVDFMLVDAEGHVDLLEIKKPLCGGVVTPSTYRDNHMPYRELSGTVMQVEKYLYHLTRDAARNERRLGEKYASLLPAGVRLQITNPRAMLLLGRDHDLTSAQRLDFEVIRRHYRNVADIVTYDDLIARLSRTVMRFSIIDAAPKRLPDLV